MRTAPSTRCVVWRLFGCECAVSLHLACVPRLHPAYPDPMSAWSRTTSPTSSFEPKRRGDLEKVWDLGRLYEEELRLDQWF